MFLAGAKNLEAKKEWINELNVFPVPDGDTGTNMTLTIMSAAKEVSALENPTMEELTKAISSGSLRGARGNSGVILSQLLRGLTKGFRDYDLIDVDILAMAMEKAVETAYKAVMKPKEGTILTVAKGAADKAVEMAERTDDLEEFMSEVISHAEYVLGQTPEMLPVLKEAGVVDSGGQGLLEVLKGAFDAFTGKELDLTIQGSSSSKATSASAGETTDIKFGYCTEFIIMLEKPYTLEEEKAFKAYLSSIGDSIVAVSDDDIVKVHVHTNDPGLAIQKALTLGSLSNMKIDNMRLEHQEKLIKDAEKVAQQEAEKEVETEIKTETEIETVQLEKAAEETPRKDTGFIAVSIGEGIKEIFTGLGVDYIIEGGQTMNPSTEDMLNAIDQVNADKIYILPNNKNIILAADQAAYLVEDKEVIVVPTKTVPQGITAIVSFVPTKTVDENLDAMIEEIERVKTGQVTYAVRETNIDGHEIHQGDIMGIGDRSILSVGTDLAETTKDMISKLIDDDSELISIYYGADTTGEEAEEIVAYVEENYPKLEVEIQMGGQPIYYYVISVE
ncbi:MAG: DAK2 domain-containing protein [Lachnospiraceae bacterium]|nr:DAK2 domain-containing protein [Lachnospiraceae bacterium]